MAHEHVVMENRQEPFLLPRRRFTQVSWGLPRANEAGFMRALGRGIRGTSTAVDWVVLPFGQGTPMHSNRAEHIIIVLQGSIEFRFIDKESAEMEPLDSLFIPANHPYAYANTGLSEVRFISVLGKHSEWPGQGNYDY